MRFSLPAALLLATLFAACASEEAAAPAAAPDDGSGVFDPNAPPEEDILPEEEGEGGAGGAGGAGGTDSTGGGEEPGGTGGTGGTGGGTTASACASGLKTQTTKGEDMNAGRACLSCHKGKPSLVVAGTVFGAPAQPNSCAAVQPDGEPISGAVMTITDAEGTVVDVDVRAKGNFLIKTKDHALKGPFLAKLTWEGRTVEKQVPVKSGDCNTCHTAAGTKGASGRIVLPLARRSPVPGSRPRERRFSVDPNIERKLQASSSSRE